MARVQTRRLTTTRTARYHVAGALAGPRPELWFALHGYGQLAADLIRAFEPALPPGRLVVAPEGLSRFYLRGTGGRVGASWMTREEREEEIADQIAYLDRLHAVLAPEARAAGAVIGLFGFSQGTPAAARWAVLGDARPARLVLWAGGFPPDLDQGRARAALAGVRVELVRGDGDPNHHRERVEEEAARLREVGVEPALVRFAGGHELEPATLQRLLAS
jgi:predicted esterase